MDFFTFKMIGDLFTFKKICIFTILGYALKKNDKKLTIVLITDVISSQFTVTAVLQLKRCFIFSHFLDGEGEKTNFQRKHFPTLIVHFLSYQQPRRPNGPPRWEPPKNTSTPVTAAALAAPRVQGCWGGRITVSLCDCKLNTTVYNKHK